MKTYTILSAITVDGPGDPSYSVDPVLAEVDWEHGEITPIMQGPEKMLLEEAKGRAIRDQYVDPAPGDEQALADLAISFLAAIGHRGDEKDDFGDDIADTTQSLMQDVLRRAPRLRRHIFDTYGV